MLLRLYQGMVAEATLFFCVCSCVETSKLESLKPLSSYLELFMACQAYCPIICVCVYEVHAPIVEFGMGLHFSLLKDGITRLVVQKM